MTKSQQDTEILRGTLRTQELLEGQFGQPVHMVVTNALRQAQQESQQIKRKEANKSSS